MRPIEPIELVRVRPGRRNGAGTSEVLTVDGLDAEAEAIERLTWTVGQFGQLALRLPLFKGDIRVRDVFVAVDGPEGTREIVREGPRARDLPAPWEREE